MRKQPRRRLMGNRLVTPGSWAYRQIAGYRNDKKRANVQAGRLHHYLYMAQEIKML